MIWLFVLLFLNNYCAISSNIDIDLTKKLLKKFNPEKPVENEKKSIFNNCWEWWECTTHVGTLRKMGLDRIQACTWDLSTIFSALPTGTLMRDFCPISCRDPECGFLGDKNKRVSESRQNSTEKPDLEAAPINFNHSDKSSFDDFLRHVCSCHQEIRTLGLYKISGKNPASTCPLVGLKRLLTDPKCRLGFDPIPFFVTYRHVLYIPTTPSSY